MIERCARWKRRAPTSSSSKRIWWLTADAVTRSSSAACRIDPSARHARQARERDSGAPRGFAADDPYRAGVQVRVLRIDARRDQSGRDVAALQRPSGARSCGQSYFVCTTNWEILDADVDVAENDLTLAINRTGEPRGSRAGLPAESRKKTIARTEVKPAVLTYS
jgi:hypothetical protein